MTVWNNKILSCKNGIESENSETEVLTRLTLDISMNQHNGQYKNILNRFHSGKDLEKSL